MLLVGEREDCNDALNGLGGIEGVQGGEHHVAGFGRVDGGADGFKVAHFADQDHVGILTERSAQRHTEGGSVDVNFTLVYESLFVAVQEFDRVLDGDNVIGASGIDVVDQGSQTGGLTTAGEPVTRTSPRRSLHSRWTILGRWSSSMLRTAWGKKRIAMPRLPHC